MGQYRRLLIIGCGDIGGGVAAHFLGQGWEVTGLRRDISQLPEGVRGVAADLGSEASMAACPSLEADYVLLTLTPAAYHEPGYRAVFEQGLERVLAKLAAPPKGMLFVSSTGVYDQRDHQWIDEESAAEPLRFSGRVLLEAEQRVAREAGLAGFAHSVIRFGGIYGPGREQMLNKVRAGQCAPAEPLHYTNRIHRDDCVGFLCQLLEMAEAGQRWQRCYLGVDSEPASIQEVQAWVADLLGIAYRCEGEPVTRTGSKRCKNQRLLDSGYSLKYPSYRQGFQHMLSGLTG